MRLPALHPRKRLNTIIMNAAYQQGVADFLAQRRIAVAGFSTQGNQIANALYEKFRAQGYEVYAVNPKGGELNGVVCYPNLAAIPQRPDAVMICTAPSATLQVLEECRQLGIRHAWIHRSIDQGSFQEEAPAFARQAGISLIPLGCPLMFLEPDVFHRCMRWIMDWRGKLEA